MAIFACKYNIPVYYTQPTIYHPDYSIGIQQMDGHPLILAYPIIANGVFIYG
jgi:hypothetical protein